MPRARLQLALALTALVAVIEFWGGWRAHSLALLSDAIHVCMDVFALAIALAATIAAARPATHRQTFGFGRIEVLAALANGTLLFAATILIAVEAVRRFGAPVEPLGNVMTAVAAIGLVVNMAVGLVLLRDRHTNMNVRAALYHVAGDALGALAVVFGGALIWRYGIAWLDPLLSLLVATIIVAGVVRILREATHVLLEGVPENMDISEIATAMRQQAGIVALHDLHVWTLGSQDYALSAHVLLDDRRISEATQVLHGLEKVLRDRYGIAHVTLQFECESCEPDDRVICTRVGGP
ncbi:MAG: cation diffusion facilitator family transporter [Candidatus Baltobacteraceae bacterium]